jgi:hypothetical protein
MVEDFIAKYGHKKAKAKAADEPKRVRAPRGKLKRAARRST